MDMYKPIVFVIVPPWTRVGSANLFSASVSVLRKRKIDTFVLVASLLPTTGKHMARRKALEAEFDLEESVRRSSTVLGSREKVKLRSALAKVLGRSRSYLDIRSRYVNSAKLPNQAMSLIRQHPIDLIYVHHAWNLRLAQRVQELSRRLHGDLPKIICETHDIQSRNVDVGRQSEKENTKLNDPLEAEFAEISLCSIADLLIHINSDDERFFKSHLPNKSHAILPPTLSEFSELELRRLQNSCSPTANKMVYAAAPNHWNMETTKWLLSDVCSSSKALLDSLQIYGRIDELVKNKDNQLYALHQKNFMGSVPRISDIYHQAKGVLVPALGGTGSSIKLLEALCLGRPTVGTSEILRGVSQSEAGHVPIEIADEPGLFAQEAERIIKDDPMSPDVDMITYYDRNYSFAVYEQRLSEILERLMGRRLSCQNH